MTFRDQCWLFLCFHVVNADWSGHVVRVAVTSSRCSGTAPWEWGRSLRCWIPSRCMWWLVSGPLSSLHSPRSPSQCSCHSHSCSCSVLRQHCPLPQAHCQKKRIWVHSCGLFSVLRFPCWSLCRRCYALPSPQTFPPSTCPGSCFCLWVDSSTVQFDLCWRDPAWRADQNASSVSSLRLASFFLPVCMRGPGFCGDARPSPSKVSGVPCSAWCRWGDGVVYRTSRSKGKIPLQRVASHCMRKPQSACDLSTFFCSVQVESARRLCSVVLNSSVCAWPCGLQGLVCSVVLNRSVCAWPCGLQGLVCSVVLNRSVCAWPCGLQGSCVQCCVKPLVCAWPCGLQGLVCSVVLNRCVCAWPCGLQGLGVQCCVKPLVCAWPCGLQGLVCSVVLNRCVCAWPCGLQGLVCSVVLNRSVCAWPCGLQGLCVQCCVKTAVSVHGPVACRALCAVLC